VLPFANGRGACARAIAMTTDSPSAVLESPSVLDAARTAVGPKPAATRLALAHSFATEWLALVAALVIVGAMIAYVLVKIHESVDATERDRLQVQARVVDDNVGQQLDGINRALASVRDDFVGMPTYSVSSLISMRLKALSDAIPGVRSMVVLDSDGIVVATSVDTLLGRDFSDRDFFRVPQASRNPATLHVAAPYKTSLGNYTVVFTRAIIGPNGTFEGVAAAVLEPE